MNKLVEKKQRDIIGETIKARKKLPKEIKNEITDSTFFNIIFVIIMAVITLYIAVLFGKTNLTSFNNWMKGIQIAVCLFSIAILESAYKRDSGEMALYGIEFLIFSVAVLYVPYMYISKCNLQFLDYVLKIFFAYYIAKSVVYLIYKRRKYLKDNLSDVKEIVKEDKKGYIDEEVKK